MKLPMLLGALLLSASPALALPARLLCHENNGVAIYEANELMEYFGKKGLSDQYMSQKIISMMIVNRKTCMERMTHTPLSSTQIHRKLL